MAINPQNRTIQYTKEDFYNPQGAVIWSKVDGRVKEITSQQFDEAFYDAIVDSVFGVGEVDRASAKDRGLTLYSHADVDGTQTHVTADTTTMRMKGDNLLFWQWSEHKDADGNVTKITFMKRTVNLPQGTERLIRAETWTPSQGWQDVESGLSHDCGRFASVSRAPATARLCEGQCQLGPSLQHLVSRYMGIKRADLFYSKGSAFLCTDCWM